MYRENVYMTKIVCWWNDAQSAALKKHKNFKCTSWLIDQHNKDKFNNIRAILQTTKKRLN